MSLVFSCIATHTPLLMPTIGKGNLAALAKTEASMKLLEQELYSTQPDTIVIISPHGDQLPDAITVNLCATYKTDFQEFGDLTTKVEWKPNTMLIDRIREDSKDKHLPLVLDSRENLDHGTAVPLWYLTQHLPNVRIVPIVTSALDMQTHLEVGRGIRDEILATTDRVAVLASADLAHTLSETAPGGFSPRGAELDALVNDLVAKNDLAGLVKLDEAWIAEAQACGAKALALLAGILGETKYDAKILSYESPFGVGCMVAELKNR